MRIDSSGNVGISNTTPGDFNSQARNLVIGGGSGDTGMTIYSGSGSGDTGNIFFADGTSGSDPVRGGITYNHGDNSMNFRTNDGANRIYISSAGNVGIGTASPTQKLDVNGTVKATGFDGSTPIVYAQGNSSTSCANNTDTKITLDNEIIDTEGLFANSRFTVTSGYEGKYLIIWQISFNHTALQKAVIGKIDINGTTVAYGQTNAAKSSNHTVIARTSIIKDLSTNDYVEFFGRQDSGSTKTTNSGIYTNASITKLID